MEESSIIKNIKEANFIQLSKAVKNKSAKNSFKKCFQGR